MKRASMKIVGVAALLLAGAVPAPPAVAAEKQQAVGAFVFEGESTLENFPCPPPMPGQFPCTGTWVGTVAGTFSGVHTVDGDDHEWAVEVLITDATAEIAYFDLVQPGVACSEGFARATGAATGGTNEVFGAYANQLPVPTSVTNINISWNFEWRRVATQGLMRFTNVAVTLNVIGSSDPVHVVVAGLGNGTAAFAPTMEPAHLAGCQSGDPPSPANDLDAQIVGTAVFFDAEAE